jgi:dihydrofolate synthase/folylpolyglutamate synthase
MNPVDWLYDLQHFGVKLGLDNIRALLEVLNHPESAYPSILVGGTNGKGSVAAMIEAMLRAHGVETGMFTSPHLVRPNERVRIDGSDISTPDLERHLSEIRQAIEEGLRSGVLETHPSFFEVITATSLRAFRETGMRCAVLEVGMGGRLDATNAVEAILSVVVTVDFDHTEKLGPTLDLIAGEKVAIAKRGRKLVSGVVQDEAREVIRQACRTAGAELIEAREAARLEPGPDQRFAVVTGSRTYDDLNLPLQGDHQRENARVAVVALEAVASELGIEPDPGRVRDGLRSVRWPGRLQRIDGDPPFLLDGAHNPSGAAALGRYLRNEGSRRRVLVTSAMRKKNLKGILQPLAGQVETVLITCPAIERAAEPEDFAGVARTLFDRVEILENPAEALARARRLASPDGYVLVAGSLYLIGEVLGILEGTPVPGPVPM